MPNFSLESEAANITLLGSFNPAIFHPEWLLRHGLISKDDHKGANVEIVHNQISKFSLEWLLIDVLHEKFIARTNDSSYFDAIRDLMCSILRILEHMPIKKMGMNLNLSFKINDEALWHKIGDNLVPKGCWEALPDRVGMKGVHVESPRPDDLKGYIQVKVTPIEGEYNGVHFDVNNHIELEGDNASDVLSDNWERVINFSKNACEKTLVKAMKS